MSIASRIIRSTPTFIPGIDRLDPNKAFGPIKYTSYGLVWVLRPYKTSQHPSLRLPRGGYVGPPGLHIRDHGTF